MRNRMLLALTLWLLPAIAHNAPAGEAEPTGRQVTDIATVLPPDTFIYMATPGAKQLLTRFRKETALGRLYDDPRLEMQRDRKLLATVPHRERNGFVYVNNAEALAWAYRTGLTVLGRRADEELKTKLKVAAKDGKALFKDVPGTLLGIRGTDDDLRARAAGGAPIVGLVPAMRFAFSPPQGMSAKERLVVCNELFRKMSRKVTFGYTDTPLPDALTNFIEWVCRCDPIDETPVPIARAEESKVNEKCLDVPCAVALDRILSKVGLEWTIGGDDKPAIYIATPERIVEVNSRNGDIRKTVAEFQAKMRAQAR